MNDPIVVIDVADPIANTETAENMPIRHTSDKAMAGRKRDHEGNNVNDQNAEAIMTANLDGASVRPKVERENDQNPFPENIWRKIGSHFPEQSKILFRAHIVAPFSIQLETAQDIQTLIRYLNQRRADHVRDICFHQDQFDVEDIPLIKRLLHALLHCPIREGTPLQGALPSLLSQLFVWASEYGHAEVVRLLFNDPRVDPAADDNYAIRWASEYGHTEVVRLLLNDPRVDPTSRNNLAIRLASKHGHAEVVRLLLNDPRVDPAADNNYAIRWASKHGHAEVVRLLLNDPRVDPTARNNLAIRLASKHGHAEVVRLLLPRVDPTARNTLAIRFVININNCSNMSSMGIANNG